MLKGLRSLLLPAMTLMLFSTASGHAEPTNFRVGGGQFTAHIGSAGTPDWLPDSGDAGISLFAEFPQSENAASRFLLYRVNGEDGARLQGGETQLMFGWGLSGPGPRAYTGPAWHYEKMQVVRDSGDRFRVFNGWGWQFGLGFQFRALTVDIAATWRNPDDYNHELNRAGIRDGDVWVRNLLLSYRF